MTPAGSRFERWSARGVLVVVTLLLGMISARFLFAPVASAGERGIVLSSGLAVTIARVGFGGFPLACALVVGWCVLSAERLRLGLQFVLTLFGTVLAVRVGAAVVDASLAENLRLIAAEVAFLALAAGALAVETRYRRRVAPAHEITARVAAR